MQTDVLVIKECLTEPILPYASSQAGLQFSLGGTDGSLVCSGVGTKVCLKLMTAKM